MSKKSFFITIILGITIFGVLAAAEMVSAAPDTLTLQVRASSDDVRVINWSGWSLSLSANSGLVGKEGVGNAQQGGIGMRFTNVTIPLGSVIHSAKLQLRASQNNNQAAVRSKIRAENAGNAQAFSDIANYHSRPRTSVEVAWDGIGAWVTGTWYDSPDIANVIQAVVGRPDWASGNAMVIFFDDHDGRSDNEARRYVSLYDSSPAFAPRLIIEYTPYQRCVKPPGWNNAEEDCFLEATYQDPMPGSGLEVCGYRIGSKIGEPDIYDMPTSFSSVPCFDMASTTAIIIMEIGAAKACRAIGEAACKIEIMAGDIAGNYISAFSTYNVSAYNLNVISNPPGINITGAPVTYGSTTNYEILNIPPGTYIELTAPLTHTVGATTYYFENWTGNCDSIIGRICQLTMDGDKTVVANFTPGPSRPDNLRESWNNCWGGVPYAAPGVNLTLRWRYNHPQGRPQSAFEIWISDLDGDFATTTQSGSAAAGSTYSYVLRLDDFGNWKSTQCNHSAEYFFGYGLCWNSHYQWRVKTKDDQGNWSVWSDIKVTNESTPQHAWPQADFSWQPSTIMVGELIRFEDKSKAYGGATTTWWQWHFNNGNPNSSNNKNPTTTFSVVTIGNRIDLEVWDNTGYHCSKSKYINIAHPLPDYKEVPPISRLDNFLAKIVNIFR